VREYINLYANHLVKEILYFPPNLLRTNIMKIFIALFFHRKWVIKQQKSTNEGDKTI
jgi:hypothetical protein